MKEDLYLFLCEEQKKRHADFQWNTMYFDDGVLFTIHASDSNTLEYLTHNNFPVVYASIDGCILVKF